MAETEANDSMKAGSKTDRVAINIPSRAQRRNRWWRRILRWWREALAFVVIISVIATAVILINKRENSEADKLIRWTDIVQVSGQPGRIPTLVLQRPVSVTSPKSIVLSEGTGREIQSEQPLIISVTSFSGQTGELLSASGRSVLHIGEATEEFFDQDLLAGVLNQNEGARILFVRPVLVEGKQTTEINVVDILYSAAHGKPGENPQGPLNVTFNDLGPIVTHAEQAPPDEVVIQQLIVGDGAQVLENDAVLAQFTAVGWEDSVVRASTWNTGIPQSIDLKTAFPGLQTALLDQRVGSRIAVTIPAEQATGETTLMMVIDIIGTGPAQEAPVPFEKSDANTPVTEKKSESVPESEKK
ncbi:peptidylprolyl isomerase [Gleimia sp. 6138-11-ORH1]|uniref:FKBP-type peptidyl-prolyl cis-trans isomerase n=1 Tax=Gleimia sp. 6138-11-ORH1 TaxID=2973937 RepID=UPI0021685EF1|nr:peptidylprolyl isomerase [Gleimia sp. 6138-11-ORH1]MCS4484288.1 peptidylprolyl isomerase [Gleimia sp. 6138-11-ORH1]